MKRKLLIALLFAAFGSFCGSAVAAPLQSVELFTPGKDRARLLFHRRDNSLTRNVPAPTDGTVHREDAPEAAYFECQAEPGREVPEFTRAEFRGRVFLPPDQPICTYNLRLADADGEIFQFNASVPKGDGQWHEIGFPVDVANLSALHWGGGEKADGKLTMPVRFWGTAGDFNAVKGTFQIGSLVCDILDSNAPLAPELLTGSGSDIHVLKKGEEKELALSLRNPRPSRRFSGVLKWSLVGVRGEALAEKEEKVSLESGEEKRLALPEPTTFGVYKLQVEVTDDDPAVRPYRKEMRFAYLIPAGPTEGRSDGFLFGVIAHPERYSAEDQRKEAMAAGWCGVKALRDDIEWYRVQPSEGTWNFNHFDRILKTFGEYGIEVMPIYDYCVGWAIAKEWKPLKPRKSHQRPDYNHWRKFVGTFAVRYRDQVRYAEIWNEPDLYGFANFSAQEYVRMLEIAYEEIKKAAPECLVLSGGFANILDRSSEGYNAEVIPAVIKSGKYDIFAFHGHFLFEEYRNKIERVLSCGNRKPWFANETAISSMVYGEEVQARTLFHKLIYSWAKGSIGYNWYDLRNDGFDPANNEHNFGMLTNDFYPKPVYAAYNALANLYQGGKFLHEVRLGSGLYGFLFQGRDGAQLLAAWSVADEAEVQPLAVSGITGKAEVVDLYGNATAVAVKDGTAVMEVGAEPLTLRVTGQSDEIKVAGALVRPMGALKIEPGKEAVFAFELHNPEARERNYRVRLTLPEGISTDAKPETLRLAPGETRKLSFPVRVKEDFRSTPGKQKELTLAFDNRNFRYRIDSVIPISAKGFRSTPDFVLDTAGQVRALVPNAPETAHLFWKGARDLSAKVWLCRDGDALLLKAEVVDDRHAQPYSGEEVWKGDNIQLGLVVPWQKIWEIGLTHLESGKSEVHVWIAPQTFSAEEVATKIELKTSRDETANLTRYEALIPFEAIGLTEEAGRAGFQFNLLVNDNDGSGRESFIEIAPGIDTKNISHYPVVKF